MSVATAHMVYFSAFARCEIFQKNARKSGVGHGQFDAGVNGLMWFNTSILNFGSNIDRQVYLFGVLYNK